MKECNRICEWNNPSNGCIKPEAVDCKMPNLFKGAKPQTNADRIRAMSDEELVDALMTFLVKSVENSEFSKVKVEFEEGYRDALLEELRQPVKDGDTDG